MPYMAVRRAEIKEGEGPEASMRPFYTLDLFAPDPFKIMLSKGVSLWKL